MNGWVTLPASVRGLIVLTISLAAILALPGCAFLNRENTPITNFVERKLSPQSPQAREALVPVVWPLAVTTLIADAALVHPVSVVDDAIHDTQDALWDEFDWDNQYATECFKLPWRAVFTPIVFGFDWLGRTLFDIKPYGHRDQIRTHAQEVLAKATQRLDAGNPAEIHAVLDELPVEDVRKLTQTQKAQYYMLRLRTAQANGDYQWFDELDRPQRRDLKRPEVHSVLLPVIDEMLISEDSYTRFAAFRFTQAWLEPEPQQTYALCQLRDPDPVIRFEGLNHPRWNRLLRNGDTLPEQVRSAIERLAADDLVSIIRARAAEMARHNNDLK